jgi:predicted Fe-Mo cluster-binding NifX family protein
MKIVVPLDERAGLGSKVSDHFGSAPYYAIADTETGAYAVICNETMQHEHGQCMPAGLFKGHGVEAVLCNGIGARASSSLQLQGIEVYMASMASTLGEAVDRFLGGALMKVQPQQACQGHGCH